MYTQIHVQMLLFLVKWWCEGTFYKSLPWAILFFFMVMITLDPKVNSQKLNTTIMAQLVKLYRESDLGMRLPAYDGNNRFCAAGLHPFTSREFSMTLVDEDDESDTARRREFKVIIKFVARADVHHFGKVPDAPKKSLQVLGVVLKEVSTHRAQRYKMRCVLGNMIQYLDLNVHILHWMMFRLVMLNMVLAVKCSCGLWSWS